MVPWSQLRQPFSGWVLTVLTAELTHFNLVIHLSKSQQLAFPFCTFLWSPALPAVPCETCGMHSLLNEIVLNRQKLHFYCCSNFCNVIASCHDIWIRQAHVFQVWYSSFWFSGEVKHIVHLIRWNLEAVLCHRGTTWHRACYGTIARTVGLGAESCFPVLFSPTSSPLVPYLMLSSLPQVGWFRRVLRCL